MRVFLVLSYCLFFASCGSSVSSSNEDDESQSDVANEPETQVLAPSSEGSMNSNEGEILGDKVSLNYEGKVYEGSSSFSGDQTVFIDVSEDSSSRSSFLVVDGIYGKLVLLEFENFENSAENLKAFGVAGELTDELPMGSAVFVGSYQVLSASNPNISGYTQAIELEVDFTSGLVSGGSVNGSSVIFRGVINGLEMEFLLEDFAGFHEGRAWFYGPNAEELLGFYIEEDQSGAIYATQE